MFLNSRETANIPDLSLVTIFAGTHSNGRVPNVVMTFPDINFVSDLSGRDNKTRVQELAGYLNLAQNENVAGLWIGSQGARLVDADTRRGH